MYVFLSVIRFTCDYIPKLKFLISTFVLFLFLYGRLFYRSHSMLNFDLYIRIQEEWIKENRFRFKSIGPEEENYM